MTPEELYDLCRDASTFSFLSIYDEEEKEEVFDGIREWLWTNKDDNTRLKAALTFTRYDDSTPLHLILQSCPPFDIVQAFINYAPEALQMRDELERLPFYSACACRASLEVIQALVNSYPESIKDTEHIGFIPLHGACWGAASLEVITFLIESYPESIKVASTDGDLPLHVACRNNASLEVLNFLIELYPDGIYQKGSVRGQKYTRRGADNNGMLPLHQACNNGYSLHLIHFLMKAQPESTTVQDNNGKTPLQYLTKTASRVDERGMLLLHREAADFSGLHVETLPILFHANPEAIRLQDKLGLLPIHHASLNEASSLDALMLLIKLYPEGIVV